MKREGVSVLRLELGEHGLGYLAGYQGGRTVAVFDTAFRLDEARPTLTLSAKAGFPRAEPLLASPWIRQQRLHPWFSNLLPEGALRSWLAQSLKVHPDNEFPLLAQLGGDLPGAIVATPLEPDDVPEHVLTHRTSIEPVVQRVTRASGFSLAGVQMKFSMREHDGRFTLGGQGELGDWIVKTPSTRHRGVPANEYTAMALAAAAGVETPKTRLVPLEDIAGLPDLPLPDERWAYAIERYDRDGASRIHAEDMAQVLFRYAHDKYASASSEQLGRLLHGYARDGLGTLQVFAVRLLVNILIGNGDAHLKNWSLYYPDGIEPELAPAYDLLFTRAWIEDERELALNLNGHKNWYEMGWTDFRSWADAVGVPWRPIGAALERALQLARERWPDLLAQSPMLESQKTLMRKHWRRLAPEWRIDC